MAEQRAVLHSQESEDQDGIDIVSSVLGPQGLFAYLSDKLAIDNSLAKKLFGWKPQLLTDPPYHEICASNTRGEHPYAFDLWYKFASDHYTRMSLTDFIKCLRSAGSARQIDIAGKIESKMISVTSGGKPSGQSNSSSVGSRDRPSRSDVSGPVPSNPPPVEPMDTSPTSSTERQWLQEYEDLVDQDYDPFHEKCGKVVFFSNKKIIATRRSDEWANGVAFSAKPIPVGGMFQVKLLEICDERCSEILTIGFTSQDPDTMDPDEITNNDLRESEYYWLFWGSTVCHGGKKQKLPPTILPSSFVEGDTIGCCNRVGDLEIHINGQKKAVGWHNVPVDKPLWGVVEMFYFKAMTIQSEFYCEHLLDKSLLNKLYPSRGCEDSTPENLEVEDSSPDGAYRMSTYPRGPAIIIKNTTFQARSGLDDIPGTEKARNALQHLFTSSGFVTSTFNDLTAERIQQLLQSYAKRNHTKAQCLIVAILTHGGRDGSLYGVDGRLVEVETLTKLFTGGKCPSLVGKPKLFFIQACRGKKHDAAVKGSEETDILQQTNETADGLKEVFLPSQSDFLLSFAVEGYASWRHAEYGSWYVRDLAEVFTKNAAKEHLLDMLTMVNDKVSKRSASKDGNKQTLSVKTQLQKNLFFKPGEYDLNHLDREPNRCCIS